MVAYNFDLILDQVVTFSPDADSLRFSTVSASQVSFTVVDTRLRVSTAAGSALLDSTPAREETTPAIFSLTNITFLDGSVFVAGDADSAETTLDGADNIIDFTTDLSLVNAINKNNQIHGLGGNDEIIMGSSAGNHLIFGGAGGDSITSGEGNSTIYGGTSLSDTSDGADSFILGAGSNDVYGNAGADAVTFASPTGVGHTLRFWGGVGADSLTASGASGSMFVQAGPDSDVITLSNAGNSTLFGGSGSDTLDITGSTGNATLYGGNGIADTSDGNDRIISGNGNVVIYANAGNDNITLNNVVGTIATVYLGAGTDSLDSAAVGGTFQIWGGPSGDVIDLTNHTGNATIYGGNGNYDPTDGNDTITGSGSGNSIIYGNAGNDRITVTPAAGRSAIVYAGAGNDTIAASPTANSATLQLFGNTGDDRFQLDFTNGAPSVRIEDYGTGSNGVDLTLSGGAAAANLTVDRLSTSDTVLRNGSSEQILLGGFRGNFTTASTKFSDSSLLITNFGGAAASLAGGVGSDQLIAGNNGDTLTAGTGGNDKLTGGNGNDRFILTTETLTNMDTIAGGAGTDTLVLGTPNTAITDFAFDHVSSIETLVILAGDYSVNGFTLGSNASQAGIVTIDAILAGALSVDLSTMTHGVSYTGGTGSDVLISTAHDDFIRGGAGDDTIIGGRGNDTIRGGTGDDVFAYQTTAIQGVDRYLDVDFGTSATAGLADRFQFDASLTALNLGNNDDSVDGAIINSVTSAGSAGTELIILRNVALNADNRAASLDIINADAAIGDGVINVFYDSSEGHVVMYYDQDGRTAGGHLKFASLENLTALTDMNVIDFSDFIFTA